MAITLASSESTPIISLAMIRSALGLAASTDHTMDAMLVTWANGFRARLERKCEQPILSASTVFLFEGEDQYVKNLPFHPVTALTSLEYWYTAAATPITASETAAVLRTGSHYTLEARGGFPRGTMFRATLTVGYTTVPDDIQTLAINAVAFDYLDSHMTTSRKGRLGVKIESETGKPGFAGVGTTYTREDFDKEFADLVTKYRRYPF